MGIFSVQKQKIEQNSSPEGAPTSFNANLQTVSKNVTLLFTEKRIWYKSGKQANNCIMGESPRL